MENWASLLAQTVNSPPAMQETQVGSLGWEDPLEKTMVTHSSVLAWRIPWTEEPGGLQSMGSQRVGLSDFYSLTCMENYTSSALLFFFFFSKSKVTTNSGWECDLKRRKYHQNLQLHALVLR